MMDITIGTISSSSTVLPFTFRAHQEVAEAHAHMNQSSVTIHTCAADCQEMNSSYPVMTVALTHDIISCQPASNGMLMHGGYSHPNQMCNSNLKRRLLTGHLAQCMSMSNAICQKRYDVIYEKLNRQPNGEDPNEEILFQNVYMTGLEYSVYKHDWKMAIMFYTHAADPKYNCFDGRIVKDENSVPSQNMYHLCENDGLPIAGFKGLYCLLNPTVSDYSETLAALWLMDVCYNRRQLLHCTDSIGELEHARECMYQIDAGSVWNEEFCQRVYTILQSLRKATSYSLEIEPFPEEICLYILDYVIDDIFTFTIWKGLMHVTASSLRAQPLLIEKNMDMDCS